MRNYTVRRVTGDIPLDGDSSETPFAGADVATIDTYPWETGGDKQEATVRALYDDSALYLQYHVDDTHSVASTTTLNGPVYEDSAVEWFARPDTVQSGYVNFEANCIGTALLGWGPSREQRESIPQSLAEDIQIETSIDGPVKTASPADSSWWLAAKLPFDTLSTFTGADIDPTPGTTWRANFQRLGGGSEFAVWNDIDAPEPDFHRPESFGTFTFA